MTQRTRPRFTLWYGVAAVLLALVAAGAAAQPAAAATVVLNNQSSCEALGGAWFGDCRWHNGDTPLVVDAGDTLQVSVPVNYGAGSFTNNGTIELLGSSFTSYYNYVNSGTISVGSGASFNNAQGTFTNNGTITVACGGTVTGTITGNQPVYPPDCVAPTATPTQLPAANAAGWNNSTVTVLWGWADEAGGSGLNPPGIFSNCITPTTVTDEGITELHSSCTDLAGNTGHASYTVKIDETAPTISAAATTPPNGAGWYKGNVTVHFTCSDALSGLTASACPADQTLSAEVSAVSSTAQTVTDKAGNVSSPSNVVTVKIDKTAPALAPVVSPNPVALGGSATATPHATDTGGSGIDSESCGTPNTSTVGDHTVTCSATDLAGNTNTTVVHYTVSYGFGGFLSPLPKTTLAKSGASIPVKFTLRGASGPLSPAISAALAANHQVQVTLSGPGTDGRLKASAFCSWDTRTLSFLCTIRTPKGLLTGNTATNTNPYYIAVQITTTPNGASNTFFTVPGTRNPEIVYFK